MIGTATTSCGHQPASESKPVLESDSSAPLEVSQIQKISFHSQALDHDMRLEVYLPKGYSSASRYPVLYMLHGYGSNEGEWFEGLGLSQSADQLTEQGKMKPLIIVSPEMDNSYGINSGNTYRADRPGDPNTIYVGRYEDYLYQDVIGYIDSHFSTQANRSNRFIGGLSMGGFISLHTAFLHPDLFSKVGGHSPALFMNDWSTTGGEQGLKAFLYPTDELRQTRDPLLLAQKLDIANLQVYLDCGDQDDYKFYDGSERLYKLLQGKGVPVEYHLNSGKHNSDYWKSQLSNYLMFYAGK